MKRRLLTAVVVLGALLGLVASAGLADSDSRPFKGSGAGPWSVLNPVDPLDPHPSQCDPLGLFGGGPFCVVEGEITVTATHLGKGTLWFTHTSDWSAGDPGCAPMLEGTTPTFRFTAADGDELFGEYDGLVCAVESPPFDLVGILYLTVTDGTGRFVGATGEVEVTGGATMPSPTGGEISQWYEGWIGY